MESIVMIQYWKESKINQLFFFVVPFLCNLHILTLNLMAIP